jgi:hypothetical protein
MKQYRYTFTAINGKRYTLIATRYEQARRHFLRFSNFYTVTYGGRHHGEPVKNNTVIAIN